MSTPLKHTLSLPACQPQSIKCKTNTGIRSMGDPGVGGVPHLSGAEAIRLIVKRGERSTPTGVPVF